MRDERETIPAPPPEEKTGPGHEPPPPFVGQPPSSIPASSAPDWATKHMEELRKYSSELALAMTEFTRLTVEVNGQLSNLRKNLEFATQQIHSQGSALNSRLDEHEGRFTAIEHRLSKLEGRAAE